MTNKDKAILVIDDDDIVREGIKDALELRDYTIYEASNGVNGLKIFSDQKIDLIVLDLNMPRMDGYMFMERINQIAQQAPQQIEIPPILILTAVDFNRDLGLSHNLGAVEYIQKPYRKEALLERIKQILNKKEDE